LAASGTPLSCGSRSTLLGIETPAEPGYRIDVEAIAVTG
jgi:hypothetical protein